MSKEELKTQDGVVVGNVVDKDAVKSPLARKIVAQFNTTVLSLIERAAPQSIHEVGCGEGRLARKIAALCNVPIRASDISEDIINNVIENDETNITYVIRSIYDLVPEEDSADLIVCCEVLEHVDDPDKAVESLKRLNASHYLLSVPREPLWRILNICSGRYIGQLGNTPGHINHWSKNSFVRFLAGHGFICEEVHTPLPWTVVYGHFSSE